MILILKEKIDAPISEMLINLDLLSIKKIFVII